MPDDVGLDLKDLRAKLTPEAHCVLHAYAAAHDLDASEVVRDVMTEWARKQIHAATVMRAALIREGLQREDQGVTRK